SGVSRLPNWPFTPGHKTDPADRQPAPARPRPAEHRTNPEMRRTPSGGHDFQGCTVARPALGQRRCKPFVLHLSGFQPPESRARPVYAYLAIGRGGKRQLIELVAMAYACWNHFDLDAGGGRAIQKKAHRAVSSAGQAHGLG